MNYKMPLIVVEDMERSRRFYEEILDQKVILDFGENITFEGGFSLQTKDSWRDFIGDIKDSIIFGSKNFELYFEEVEFPEFAKRIKASDVELLHEVVEYPWGQNVIRFFDPDKHVIEVGESMISVIWRFKDQGLSDKEISERTQHPMEYVEEALKERL